MATITRSIGSLSDAQTPPGYCTVELLYDDQAVPLILGSIHVSNGTNAVARLTLTSTNGQRSFSRDINPGVDATRALPTGAATRLGITIDARGRIDGVDLSMYLL